MTDPKDACTISLSFIDEIKSETTEALRSIKESTIKIKNNIHNLASVRKDELKAFVFNDLLFNVRTTENEIKKCKNKIAFVLSKINEILDLIKDANDKDLMNAILKGGAGVGAGGVVVGIASVAFLPVALPVAGIVAGLAGLVSVLGYRERKNERIQFRNHLKYEKCSFQSMKLNLGAFKLYLKNLQQIAEKFRKHAL